MKIDRHAPQRDAAGLHEPILMIQVPQVETVHRSRHARRVRIPVQQVEGNRFLSQQIIVHNEGPDKIVRAQHIERCRHVTCVQISLLLHALLERRELSLVDEHSHVSDIGEIDQRDKISSALDAVI